VPSTFLNRQAIFNVDLLHAFISALSLPWTFTESFKYRIGTTVDDITTVEWNTVGGASNRKLVVFKKGELNPDLIQNILRNAVITETEIYAIISSIPGWGGGTSALIDRIDYETAGKRLVITRVQESY